VKYDFFILRSSAIGRYSLIKIAFLNELTGALAVIRAVYKTAFFLVELTGQDGSLILNSKVAKFIHKLLAQFFMSKNKKRKDIMLSIYK